MAFKWADQTESSAKWTGGQSANRLIAGGYAFFSISINRVHPISKAFSKGFREIGSIDWRQSICGVKMIAANERCGDEWTSAVEKKDVLHGMLALIGPFSARYWLLDSECSEHNDQIEEANLTTIRSLGIRQSSNHVALSRGKMKSDATVDFFKVISI